MPIGIASVCGSKNGGAVRDVGWDSASLSQFASYLPPGTYLRTVGLSNAASWVLKYGMTHSQKAPEISLNTPSFLE